MAERYWIETLGCPKNQVDSDKLEGTLIADGMKRATSPSKADVIVLNTCAFIEPAKAESIDVALQLADAKKAGARLVLTGCMAERYGSELADALPEADLIAGFNVPIVMPRAEPADTPVAIGRKPAPPLLDLLNLPRPKSSRPWAYVKIAEGCDRSCGFCAIPSFRGPQRSRDIASILAEVDQLGAKEIVLVAQDLASYGKDRPADLGAGSIVPLVKAVADQVARVRLLYLYPSDLTDDLIATILGTGVPYFDLSLQHVSKKLLRGMRRWGDGDRFLKRINEIRAAEPSAAFRSNFIVGYPGETESDHDQLLAFVEAAQLDWCGFFPFSREEGTYAAGLAEQIAPDLIEQRLRELTSMQDTITAERRDLLIGECIDVLVDDRGVGRSHREAPEIDGIVVVPDHLGVGEFHRMHVVDAMGPDLHAELEVPGEVAR